MPGRNFNSPEYRFGFNGQEKDDEITGVPGAHTTAMFWEYDTRIGRRWNLDPKPQIGISDYACFGNNPIRYSDILGDRYSDDGDKKSRAERKFDKKITTPLKEMERQGKTPDEIQNEADRLSDKYQRTNWLHKSANYSKESYTGGLTGMPVQQMIRIKAYSENVINVPPISNNRPNDGALVNVGDVGVYAPPGSTVNVQFDPFSVPNALTLATVDPNGGASTIASTGGMISNTNGTSIYTKSTAITTANAGQIQYTVQNSNTSLAGDNWQLRVQVTTPLVLNPIPLIVSNYPFP